jgi:hypothetical protein
VGREADRGGARLFEEALAAPWRLAPCVTPPRSRKLDGLSDWRAERFRRHRGNADVIRPELAQEKGIEVNASR